MATAADNCRVIDYASPRTDAGRRFRWAWIGYALPVLGGWLSLRAVWACYHIAMIWPAEAYSWCGTVRMAIRGDMGQMPYVLLVSAVIAWQWRRRKWIGPALRIALIAAAVGWLVVYPYTKAYFTWPYPGGWFTPWR